MNDGILSQEEIDALLNGDSTTPAQEQNPTIAGSAAEEEQPATDTLNPNGTQSAQEQVPVAGDADARSHLSDFDKDTLGEIGNICMGTAATALSTILQRRVDITTPNVSCTDCRKLQSDYPLPYVIVEVSYTEGLRGTNVLIIKKQDACIIADLMMGGDGTGSDLELDEIKLSAVGEAMNQMMGSATTSLSSMFNYRIDIAPPNLTVVDLAKNELKLSTGSDDLVQIKFKMEIENLINSEIMQIIPMEAVKSMISGLIGTSTEETKVESLAAPAPAAPATEAPAAAPVADVRPAPAGNMQREQAAHDNILNMPAGGKKNVDFAVQPVQFPDLNNNPITSVPQNIGLIMDVPLNVTVELGKTEKSIKEVLELTQGSIIQLDKMAGEPVDLLVNGKLVAKGEVVVIDENYGIRVTAIISPGDRMNKLQ